jgi:DNA transposition AAA+ family ATPase
MSSTTPTPSTDGADVFVAPIDTCVADMQAAGYAQGDIDDLAWFCGYVRADLHGSRAAAVQAVGYSYTTIYRVLRGKFEAAIDNFMESVRKLRRQVEERAGVHFVETEVTRRIWAELDYCRDFAAMVHVSGRTGRSKTYSAVEWQRRNNHGRSVYLDVPVLNGLRPLLEALARALGIGQDSNSRDLCARIEKGLRGKVLILDEVARLVPAGGYNVRCLEYLRRLHDQADLGLAFVSTRSFDDHLVTGRLAGYLEQFLGRLEDPLVLPEFVLPSEAADIARAFAGQDDPELAALCVEVDKTVGGHLRTLYRLLRHAKLLADARHEPVAARHLAAALKRRKQSKQWSTK